MRRMEDYNPITVFLCFAGILIVAMFCMDPVLLILSFFGAAAYTVTLNGARAGKSLALSVGAILFLGICNPLFQHNGRTVFLIINNNPVTVEAVCYGLGMGLMLSGVLLWFSCFTKIMTTDKLLYLFGSVSPKLALILSMTLRYLPLYKKQAEATAQTQKALGLYRENNWWDSLKGSLRIFSVMVTWALENGVITADSMTARGYGTAKRTRFSIFTFRRADGILAAAGIALTVLTLFFYGKGAAAFTWYPALSFSFSPVGGTILYLSYGILCLMPAALTVREEIRWRSLRSEI